MSLTLFRSLQRLLTPAPVNAPIAQGDRVDEALNKLQGQINAMPLADLSGYQEKAAKDQDGGYVGVHANGCVGIDVAVPLAPLHVGARTVSNSADPTMLVARVVDDATTGNARGYSDSSSLDRGGNISYASFDARIDSLGTQNYLMLAGFQHRPTVAGSGTVDELVGFRSFPIATGGAITKSIGFTALDPQVFGVPVAQNYGFYCPQLSVGSVNWAFYSEGSTPSYFGGNVSVGGNVSAVDSVQAGSHIQAGTEFRVAGIKVVGARLPAIPNSTSTISTSTVDGVWTITEANVVNDMRIASNNDRAKINAILAALRSHGLIAP